MYNGVKLKLTKTSCLWKCDYYNCYGLFLSFSLCLLNQQITADGFHFMLKSASKFLPAKEQFFLTAGVT